MSDLHFVFLQGMPSPFFSRIGQELSGRGCKVTGINLCFGDRYFWRGENTVDYRGPEAGWPSFFGDFLDREKVTDLVLLGEKRSYHLAAIRLAKLRNIRVAVTDFGYLRPDWITLEQDAMGGESLFPKDIGAIKKRAADLPALDLSVRYADSFRAMARGDLIYSFGNVFFSWLYPGYRRPDKRKNPFIYFPAMGVRLLSQNVRERLAQDRLNPFLAARRRFFVFALQLEHDFQIVSYSPFTGMEQPIAQVIRSFARHCDPATHLLIKSHPFDPGLRNWEKLIGRIAGECGVSKRIVYIEGGNLDHITARAAGMVTVNSTSGLKALQLGKPVKTLGQAIYDLDGLTFQKSLDSFWQSGSPPDPANVEAFLKMVAATIQIRGVFFCEPGLSQAVALAADRLYYGTVGQFWKEGNGQAA
ncbi:MAG: capsular biosynthesis protein [Syntrophobacteraceae bacterium]|nr:capsular biosynthesis protein [Syntrophobacteraceae bacterium]